MRLYNPNTSQWLQTPPERVETAEARAQQESTARKIAEARAESAEAALAEALAELERLQSEKND